MNDTLQILIELTEMDHAALETQAQLDGYPDMLKALERAETAAAGALEKTRAGLDAAKLARTGAEKDAAAMREKISRLERQQAMVKTEKEAEAMAHEIASLGERIDERETEGLEALINEEDLTEALAKAERKLAHTRKDNEAERVRIAEQTEEKKTRLERLRVERGTWTGKLDAEAFKDYERLHARHPGSALAPVDGETCSGCHWALTNNIVTKARAHSLQAHCEHCGRLVYVK